MRGSIKVLFVSAECEPYARTGGLGDVSSALPKELKDKQIDIRRVMPLYRGIDAALEFVGSFKVRMGDRYQDCIIEYDPRSYVPTYFIRNSFYFDRENMYGYYEDGERFLFFCKAAVAMLEYIGFTPDIIHCNDWHSAMIPLILKELSSPTATVYTIHSLRFSGSIPPYYLGEFSMDKESGIYDTGYPDNIDFMRAGIIFADCITTVSPSYADEIMTPEFGEGLDKILLRRKGCITGILNGIDVGSYDPLKADVPFSARCIGNKYGNSKLLREELGLGDDDVPIVSSVTRLDTQKGIDLILGALKRMGFKNFQFVILGTGSEYYQHMLSEIALSSGGRMAAVCKFDTDLSKRIYAGSDIFVMPSMFEPCGISQQIAMNYGGVPVARSTGGLKDTVFDLKNGIERANGFLFNRYTVNSFVGALKRALKVYRDRDTWERLVLNSMTCDRSWNAPALRYIDIYRSLCEKKGFAEK